MVILIENEKENEKKRKFEWVSHLHHNFELIDWYTLWLIIK